MREEPAEFDDGIMIASPTCSTYIDNPPEPLPYHRMARLTPRTRKWWRPLLVMLLAAGLIGAFFAVSLVVTVLFGVLPGMPEPTADMEDPRNPVDMFATLGMLAIGVPAVALAFRWAGGRRRETAGTLHSVVGRFRWSLMGRAALVVVPVFLVANVGGFFLLPPPDLSIPRGGLSLVLVYVVILAVTPLQCAAEEYVFRALPQQVLGTWLRLPVWGILLPVPLFVAGHGYSWVGQIDIAVFAVCTGLLVWKTGGVELSILVHAANNGTLFLVAPFSPSSMHQGDTSPLELLFSMPPLVLTTFGLIWWVSRRDGLRLLEPVRGRGRLTPRTVTSTMPDRSDAAAGIPA